MTYLICISERAQESLEKLSVEDYQFCKQKLVRALEENPFPGHDGDNEKLGENKYRIHIGRSYTAMYRINVEKKIVRVYIFGTIGKVHKQYHL